MPTLQRRFRLLAILFFIGAFFSQSQTQWIQTNGPFSGNVLSLGASKTALFAGIHEGGVVVSLDQGASWGLTNLWNMSVNSFAVSGNTIFAGTQGQGVYMFTDGGSDFYSAGSGITQNYIHSLAFNANTLFAGTISGAFISIDSGKSWISAGLENKQVVAFAFIGSNIFAGISNEGVFMSTNNGQAWKQVNTGLADLSVQSLAVNGSSLFAGTWGGGVFVSDTNGESWISVNKGLADLNIHALALSGTRLFAGSLNGLFLSDDNGSHWTPADSGLTVKDVSCFSVAESKIFIGTWGGGICLSNDHGTFWSPVNQGLADTDVRVLAQNGTSLFAGTYGAGVFISSNNGSDWSPVNSGITNTNVFTFTVLGSRLLAGTQGGIFLSTDNGSNWTPSNNGLISSDITGFAIDGSNLYTATYYGGVCVSADSGENWTPIGMSGTPIYAITAGATGVFTGNGEGVYRYAGDRYTWTKVNSGLTNTVVVALATDGTNLFAGTLGGIFVSPDKGTSWTLAGLEGIEVHDLFMRGKNMYAGTMAHGVGLSTDGGLTWKLANNGFEGDVYSVLANETHAFAGSGDNGVWRRPLLEMLTGVRDQETIMPARFAMMQNHPNPFNGATAITFSLPHSDHVVLTVVNNLGRKISLIADRNFTEGTHKLVWDSGQNPSGIYFVCLKAGSFQATRKMILAK